MSRQEVGYIANSNHATTVDAYIQLFPDDVRAILEKTRQIVRSAAPDTIEAISYDIPSYALNGEHLAPFAGWKHHISLYPTPAGDSAYQQDIEPYKKAKATLQLPLEKPIPYDLVERTVTLLVKES